MQILQLQSRHRVRGPGPEGAEAALPSDSEEAPGEGARGGAGGGAVGVGVQAGSQRPPRPSKPSAYPPTPNPPRPHATPVWGSGRRSSSACAPAVRRNPNGLPTLLSIYRAPDASATDERTGVSSPASVLISRHSSPAQTPATRTRTPSDCPVPSPVPCPLSPAPARIPSPDRARLAEKPSLAATAYNSWMRGSCRHLRAARD